MKKRPSYEELEQENAVLRRRVAELEEELAEVKTLLKRLLGQDSRTSHKPPSLDPRRYPRTQLKASKVREKKQREKETLAFSDDPDETVELKVAEEACVCGQAVTELESYWERVQVIDLPELRLAVREYRRERKWCSCGVLHEATLPAGVHRGVQYGARVKGLLSYLHQYQLLPLGRCVELMGDLFGQAMCEKSLLNAQSRLFDCLVGAEAGIKEGLRSSEHLYADETGVFVKQQNQWLHVRSNEGLTFYHIDASRGSKAHQAIGLLEHYSGHMVHDCYHSYFKQQGSHVLCHSHTLRELLSVWEETSQDWAYALAELLLAADEERKSQGLRLKRQAELLREYRELLAQGLAHNPEKARSDANTSRGKVKQTKAHNLIKRLLEKEEAAVRFIRDPTVPFTNNQAERDLRMVKLKQKISGGFQTGQGARMFCRIRGYISTIRKQGFNVLETLTSAFQDNVIIPAG